MQKPIKIVPLHNTPLTLCVTRESRRGPWGALLHRFHRRAIDGSEAEEAWSSMMTKPHSPTTGPSDSFELTLSDVYLLTTESQGEITVPGLTVVLDQLGLTVVKPDGAVGAVLAWDKLRSLRTAERVQMPSGTCAVVVEAVSDDRTHRFAVPSDDPDGLEAAVARLASSRSARGAPGAPSGHHRS